MEPGFNSDIVYQGKSYHVQTEDWGADKSIVVTRVFSGGSVVASLRTPYQRIESESFATGRRAIQMGMREQHQKILDQLVSGALLNSGIK